MRSLVDNLDCGIIKPDSRWPLVRFVVTRLSLPGGLISDKIIPLFTKYPLEGVKRLDYVDFCKVAELMGKKAHLTPEGLEQIRKIQAGMNTLRSY